MEFKDLLRMTKRRWKAIVSMFLLAVAASAALTFSATPIYHSTARVFISTQADSSNEVYFAGAFAAQRVTSYADLATSRELMQRVVRRLNLNLTPTQLAERINATVVPNTVIIQVEVRDPDPQTAKQITQAEAEELAKYLNTLESSPDGTSSRINANITDPANYVDKPVSPRSALNLIVGAFLGLLVGFGLAIVRELLDNSVSSANDVEKTVEAPVLASIGLDPDMAKHPLLTEAGSHSSRVEAYRLLRTNLQFLNPDTRPRSIVITSALAAEGKTSTATNLAIALAQNGLRVLLVDGDLRRPNASAVLGLERSVGLTTVLVGRSQLNESIQRHAASGIYFLASGPIPPNPTEILQSRTAQSLFSQLEDMFDMVIVDAPPLLPVSDAAILAREVDGAIVVVRHGRTTREQLRLSSVRLEQVGARMLGVLVNMTPKRAADEYGYSYGYGYEPLAPRSHAAERS